ncbi:glycosyltransferase [Paenibacillus sp. N3.4]|uniref:glycosyltransferase family 2 protein n=1 Tax=Paenibacillus sp. N3.4 TaxID=2603222 RepID=UPI0011C8AB23|nr:glycosyltransferase [Paenibacillus sp. N3.4]TXK80364.1 glycosyltransferase [Paenibacillus sp. N3.4]
MNISIILLAQHFNLTIQCIDRIKQYTAFPYELIIVSDNDSEEVSRYIAQDYNVRVIHSSKSKGVAAAYNQGAASSSGERLVFIRDQIMVREGWLEQLSGCLDQYPNASIVGPMMNDVSGAQRIPIVYQNYEQLYQMGDLLAIGKSMIWTRVPRLVSLLMMMPRHFFDEVGAFDERFEIESFEDDDICYQALLNNYDLYVAEGCVVFRVEPPAIMPNDPDWYNKQLTLNRAKAISKWGFDLTEALYSHKRKVTVSLCMIVKNEEQTLGRCLSSVRDLVDEIIIVDTGSSDATKEIASSYASRVYDFEWVNDFSKARNYAFSLATQEYILWLDADDYLLSDDARVLQSIIAELSWHTDVVSMHYYLDRDKNGHVTSSLRRNRLVKRSCGFRWIGTVHEYLEVSGPVLYAEMGVTHDRKHTQSMRNLLIYEGMLEAKADFSTRDQFYFANELYDHSEWIRAVEQYDTFLASADGWVEDKIFASRRAADALAQLGRFQEAKIKVLQAFAYALPRAEACCQLGYYELAEQRLENAVFWYKLATEAAKPIEPNARMDMPSWTWLPHLQLCVCYDLLGRYEQANYHNEIAGGYKSDYPSVIANRDYLKQYLT